MTFPRLSLLALGMAVAAPAVAADNAACGAGMVCASNPQTIVAALQKAGYTAELTKDDTGDPMINSAASGYKFSVMFYGCEKAAKCDSVQFQASFDANDSVTADYVNKWNRDKRFMQASVNDEKEMQLRYDVATIGGVNATNFKDVLDWWSAMLGEYSKYAGENLN